MRNEARQVIVVASPPEHFMWLKKRTALELSEGLRAVEARAGGDQRYCRLCGEWHGRILGMVGYNGWRPTSVMLHVAIDRPCCIPALRAAAFEYAFLQADKHVAIGVTPGENARALRFSKHLGFKELVRIKEGPGQEVVVQELRREHCRWLPKEND